MKKRILSTLLALCMALALLPGTALAATVASGKCGANATWTLDTNGTLTVKGTGSMADYGTSSTPWHARRDDITKVVISKGILTVGKDAFYKCRNLTEVTLGEGLTTIGIEAFDGCTNLLSISIPASVGTIRSYAFDYCSRLKNIYYGGSETQWNNISIDSTNYSLLFSAGSRIYYAGSPKTQTIVSGQCGANATWSFDSQGTLTVKGTGSMYDYGTSSTPWHARRSAIKKVVISKGIVNVGKDAFYKCSNLTSVSLAEGVTTIGIEAFDGCSNLPSIVIPASMGTIKKYAFDYCSRLKTIYYAGSQAQWNAISIDSTNNSILYAANSKIVYNYHAAPATYTVTLHPNNGSSSLKKTYQVNKTLGTLPTPKRSGYKFSGWYTAASGGTKVSATTKVSGNMALYARWVKDVRNKTFLVSFNANGGTVEQDRKIVRIGSVYGDLPAPTKANSHFKGWYTKKTGGTKVTAASRVTLTANQALYAQWQPSATVRSTQGGTCRVTIPAYYELALYTSKNSPKIATQIETTGYRTVTCTQKATLSNGTVRYYGKVNNRSYWFTYSCEMDVK